MNRFIGLLDSGMGGLTVLNQILASLPDENTAYFGDMERAPCGSRSPEVISRHPEIFRSSGERYLNRKIHQVSLVDIGDLKRKG